jgi:hypothetical protein
VKDPDSRPIDPAQVKIRGGKGRAHIIGCQPRARQIQIHLGANFGVAPVPHTRSGVAHVRIPGITGQFCVHLGYGQSPAELG